MRWLLLALCLYSGSLKAACAAGTVEFWNFSDQSLVGDCFGLTFSSSTSQAFANIGCPPSGTFAASTFSAASNTKVTSANITAMAAGSYTWEVYVYKYSRFANSYVLNFQTGAGTGQADCLIVGDGTADNITVRTNNTQRVTLADTGALNHCVYYGWVGTATAGNLWMGVDGATPTRVTGVAANCLMTSTVDTLVLGTTAGSTALFATMNNIRISNIAQPSLPTVDPAATNQRNLKLRKILQMKLSYLLELFTSKAEAKELDQVYYQKYVNKTQAQIKVKETFVKTTTTRTLTATPGPKQTATPTPTPTHTPTQTPLPTPKP